jgi:hypothetical protein
LKIIGNLVERWRVYGKTLSVIRRKNIAIGILMRKEAVVCARHLWLCGRLGWAGKINIK